MGSSTIKQRGPLKHCSLKYQHVQPDVSIALPHVNYLFILMTIKRKVESVRSIMWFTFIIIVSNDVRELYNHCNEWKCGSSSQSNGEIYECSFIVYILSKFYSYDHHSELRSIIANIPWSFWSPQVFEWVHNIPAAPSWMATGQRPHLAVFQIWLHRTYNWGLNVFYYEINSKSIHNLEKYTLHEAHSTLELWPVWAHVSSMGHCTCVKL